MRRLICFNACFDAANVGVQPCSSFDLAFYDFVFVLTLWAKLAQLGVNSLKTSFCIALASVEKLIRQFRFKMIQNVS